MPRGSNPTSFLARFFVEEILEQEWNYQFGMRWLREAKILINPEEDKGRPLDYDLVKGTLRALKRGWFGFDGKVGTMLIVTYGDPPYYTQYKEYLESPPPFYNKGEVLEWEKETGRIAYSESRDIISEVPSAPVLSNSEGNLYE